MLVKTSAAPYDGFVVPRGVGVQRDGACDGLLVIRMASREIYADGFDEDVQTDDQTSGCPECGGRVATNAIETVCEECGLVLEEHAIDHSGRCTRRGRSEQAHYSRRRATTVDSRR